MKYKFLITLLYFDDTLKSKYKNMLIIIIIIIFSHLTIENFQNHFNFWILNISVWKNKGCLEMILSEVFLGDCLTILKQLCLLRATPLMFENILIIKHFSVFLSFLNQIEQFLCHCTRKLKGYISSLSIRSEGVTQNTKEESEW
jgi:hypothetical protein